MCRNTSVDLRFINKNLLLEKNNFITDNIWHNMDHLEHCTSQTDSCAEKCSSEYSAPTNICPPTHTTSSVAAEKIVQHYHQSDSNWLCVNNHGTWLFVPPPPYDGKQCFLNLRWHICVYSRTEEQKHWCSPHDNTALYISHRTNTIPPSKRTVQWSLLNNPNLTMATHVPVITHQDHIQHCFHLPYRPQACDSIILNYWPHPLYCNGFHNDWTK